MVKETSKDETSVRFPKGCPCENQEVALALSSIVLIMKKKHKLHKRGQSAAQMMDGHFHLNVECVLDRKMWKVCFHVEKSEVSEDPC